MSISGHGREHSHDGNTHNDELFLFMRACSDCSRMMRSCPISLSSYSGLVFRLAVLVLRSKLISFRFHAVSPQARGQICSYPLLTKNEDGFSSSARGAAARYQFDDYGFFLNGLSDSITMCIALRRSIGHDLGCGRLLIADEQILSVRCSAPPAFRLQSRAFHCKAMHKAP